MEKELLLSRFKDNIMVISSDESDVRRLSDFFDIGKLHSVPDLDTLLYQLDTLPGELTLCFMENLPDEIRESMATIVHFISESENDYSILEFGKSYSFKNSVVIDSLEFVIEVLNSEDALVSDELVVSKEDTYEGLSGSVGSVSTETYESVVEQFEVLKVEAKKRIEDLNGDLSKYKRLYGEKMEVVSELEDTIARMKEELMLKTELIEGDLSNREGELNKRVDELTDELNNAEVELRSLKALVGTLQEDLNNSRKEYSSLSLDLEAQRELLVDKKRIIDNLTEKLEIEESLKREVLLELSAVKTEYLSPLEFGKLQEELDNKDDDIDSLKAQLNDLRIIAKKSDTEKVMLEEDLKSLKITYKELLNEAGSSTRNLDEIVLDDSIAQIMYFKVINQPLYFKSFMEELSGVLRVDKKVLVVILRDEDELTSIYYKGIRKVTTLDDVISDDEVVWVKPSKLMFPKEVEFYNAYDVVIFIDHLNTKKRYVRGENVTTIHTFLDQREAEMLGVSGMILSAGDRSVVDMKYDEKFVLAPTKVMKRLLMKRKVKDWLRNIGMN